MAEGGVSELSSPWCANEVSSDGEFVAGSGKYSTCVSHPEKDHWISSPELANDVDEYYISDLDIKTTYEITVTSINHAGTSVHSASLIVITDGAPNDAPEAPSSL